MFNRVPYTPLKLQVRFSLGPVGNYLFTVNNRNTRTRCEICLKFKIKTVKTTDLCLYC